ncbi:hypothetical protein F5144DRAFT_576542 [Chaetomium tenue]|uniref:Uncharacterized protein n=1 Tax=Chaetomium tenue TaxID=1854479 RepID=A0ACB7P3D6_9PEZI|nr:hypothetical protein F5144DRAFT_576542 [Chaetomium globosum]
MVPLPHHRRRSSLEGIISFSDEPALEPAGRARLSNKFQRIVNHFEGAAAGGSQYNRPRLVRLTYEYVRSEVSKDIFLRTFFRSMGLTLIDEQHDDDIDFENCEEELSSGLSRFADYFFDNFFLPLRASALKTPQFPPVVHSERAQGGAQDFIGRSERMAGLREDCLVRDRHRCVASRRFDIMEAADRFGKPNTDAVDDDAVDDDGNRLATENKRFAKLEVAHILPRPLTDMGSASQLPPSKKAALNILNMFDGGVTDFLQGTDIDRPRNAITLNPELHLMFSRFQVFYLAESIPTESRLSSSPSFCRICSSNAHSI